MFLKRKKRKIVFAAVFICVLFLPGFKAKGAVLAAKYVESPVMVDGKEVFFEAYHIGGNNFFKIRDIAYAVMDSEKEFSVSWDTEEGSIFLTSSKDYTPVGGELSVPETKEDKAAKSTQAAIYVNGEKTELTAYTIEGSNYFKIRDIAEIFNFGVDWDKEKEQLIIDTSKNYGQSEPAFESEESSRIYSQCAPAVFYLPTFDMHKNLISTGSGFFISEDGVAVTNFHVLQEAFYAQAVLPDGSAYQIESVIDYDIEKDIALVKVNGTGFSYLKKGDSKKITGGSKIYTLSSPLGLNSTITEGIVSNPQRVLEGQSLIQISAPISHGSSGGALLNQKGEVIGITSSGVDNGQNLNFAIPVEELESLNENKTPVPLSETAKAYEKVLYETRPDFLEVILEEEEPNNVMDTANLILNGDTYLGTIDKEKAMDIYFTTANCAGTLKITGAFAEGGNSEITVGVTSSQNVLLGETKAILLSDDGYGFYLECEITQPDYYYIGIYDASSNNKSAGEIYGLYMEFVPAA